MFYEGKKIRHSKIWWAFFFQKFFFILIFHHHLLKSIISGFFLQLLCCNAHFFFDFCINKQKKAFFRKLFFLWNFVCYLSNTCKEKLCMCDCHFLGKNSYFVKSFLFFMIFFVHPNFFFQRFFSIRIRKGTISFIFLD